MDFLGNQTRMNYPGNKMGDGFSWESNRGFKKKINKVIRLVPTRIESGRATSEKGSFMAEQEKWVTLLSFRFSMKKKGGKK